METLPSYAKVAEYQLGIVSADDAPRNVMNLKIQAAPKSRELWAGKVAFAAMTRANLQLFLSWLSQFDGRYTSWLLPMPAGVQTISDSHTGTLTSAVAAGAASFTVTVSPASGTIAAGTLLTVGTSTADAYQVFEVVTDAVIGGATVALTVAPRVRWAFSAGATVTFGATSLRVRLADDGPVDHELSIAHGVVTVGLVEAVYV